MFAIFPFNDKNMEFFMNRNRVWYSKDFCIQTSSFILFFRRLNSVNSSFGEYNIFSRVLCNIYPIFFSFFSHLSEFIIACLKFIIPNLIQLILFRFLYLGFVVQTQLNTLLHHIHKELYSGRTMILKHFIGFRDRTKVY